MSAIPHTVVRLLSQNVGVEAGVRVHLHNNKLYNHSREAASSSHGNLCEGRYFRRCAHISMLHIKQAREEVKCVWAAFTRRGLLRVLLTYAKVWHGMQPVGPLSSLLIYLFHPENESILLAPHTCFSSGVLCVCAGARKLGFSRKSTQNIEAIKQELYVRSGGPSTIFTLLWHIARLFLLLLYPIVSETAAAARYPPTVEAIHSFSFFQA